MKNFAYIEGKLIRFETINTNSGKTIGKFDIAFSSGKETSYIGVTLWDPTEDQVQMLTALSNGGRIGVLGRLQQEKWEAKDGSKRSTIRLVASSLAEVAQNFEEEAPAPTQATRQALHGNRAPQTAVAGPARKPVAAKGPIASTSKGMASHDGEDDDSIPF